MSPKQETQKYQSIKHTYRREGNSTAEHKKIKRK